MSDFENTKPTVLVADDTTSIANFVKYALEENGFEAHICFNGFNAIEMANELMPDLILLDIMMPDIDGYQVCSQIKANEKTSNIPIIFISALESQFDKIRAFKCGAVDYVSKPIQREELIARVKTHIALNKSFKNKELYLKDLELQISNRTSQLITKNENLENLNQLLKDTLATYKEEKEQLEHLNKQKQDFFVEIISQFRTVINSTIENLNQENNIDNVRSDVFSMLNIVDNIVGFTLLDDTLNLQTNNSFNVKESIQNIFLKYQSIISQKNIRFVNNVNISDKTVLLASDKKFEQVLDYLIGNAIRFTNEGEIEIGGEEGNNSLNFYVRDTGVGIPVEMYSKVFDKQHKVLDENLKNYRGMSLGLSITKNLVESMGGQIWFDSTPNKSTIFYFSVPNIQTETSENFINLSGKKILVGEDEDLSFILISNVLKPTGVEILRAKNYRELLEEFRSNSIDLIITSLNLDNQNCKDAIKVIKKLNSESKIIVQLSYFNPQDKRDFMEIGCLDYLERPIKKEDLIAKIKKYL